MTALTAQTRTEVVLTLRRGESLLLILAIPLLLLGFFSLVDVLPKGDFEHSVDFLVPGVLALAIMSTGMVQLAIGTSFERQYGVLKRLGSTPLGRPRLLAAKTASIIAVEVVQIVLVVGAGLALGWDPHLTAGVVPAVILGTIAFSGIGLLMAGLLRGEVTLAAANGLYLVLLLIGGMVVPLSELPEGLRWLAELLPSGALAQALVGTMSEGGGVPAKAWIVLAVWAVAAPLAAARTFRWE
ncbi:MAG TPA: ABC transporter permease [Acidimicrobiales bacterium]|nr:ABC transporter permease [Acidimicrobiales bacterium]